MGIYWYYKHHRLQFDESNKDQNQKLVGLLLVDEVTWNIKTASQTQIVDAIKV